MHIPTAILLALFLVTAEAHFLLNYPQTRGFDEDKEPNFCGGFPLSNNRSQFPLSGGIVSITSEHPKADVDILISFESDPTTFANFDHTSSGATIPFLMPFTQMNAQGDACFPVNVSSLGVADAKDGANATIMIQFSGGDGQLFQCADITLSNTFTVPTGTKCNNATGAFPVTSSTTGSPPASNTSSPGGTTASPNGVDNLFTPFIMTGILGLLAGLVVLAV